MSDIQFNWSEENRDYTLKAFLGEVSMGSAIIKESEESRLTRLSVRNNEGRVIHGYCLSKPLEDAKQDAENEIINHYGRNN
jgi:hypothetical protein